jgi:putative membrane protein
VPEAGSTSSAASVPGAASMSSAQINTELAMRRTGMSFQRTRMAADRTLMAIIRTSLSLISFGFTIYQFFNKLKEAGVLKGEAATRNFGASLLWLGIGMLILGIIYHVLFMLGLRKQRGAMKAQGLIWAESQFPASLVLITAVVLLLIGLSAALSIGLHTGPFQ